MKDRPFPNHFVMISFFTVWLFRSVYPCLWHFEIDSLFWVTERDFISSPCLSPLCFKQTERLIQSPMALSCSAHGVNKLHVIKPLTGLAFFMWGVLNSQEFGVTSLFPALGPLSHWWKFCTVEYDIVTLLFRVIIFIDIAPNLRWSWTSPRALGRKFNGG